MSIANDVSDFVEYVIKQTCPNADDISVEIVEDEKGSLVLVKAPKEEMGRIIGKEGRNVSALRTLITTIAARDGEKISLKVEEK